MTPTRVLLVFVDGVGIGPADPEVNPLARAWARGLVPTLHELTGGIPPTLDEPRPTASRSAAFPLDATLGTDGIPQSGTGQTALLTGQNAAALHGRHFGPWTPVRLRPLVEAASVLKLATAAGHTIAFANAYPRDWPGARGGRRIAAPPLAARGAGVLDRHEEHLVDGAAVSSEIVNDGWRRHLGNSAVPVVGPEQAGMNLARIAATADLTLYAHYATDTAGHRRDMGEALLALERVDRFLAGVLTDLSPDTLLLVASDHGNLEDVRVGHTRSPALGMAVGPASERAATLADLREVTPFVLTALGARARGATVYR